MAGEFGWFDYTVVGGTLLFSILIGAYYAIFAKQKTEDLLVGGRNMGAGPIAASMLVTYLSAITVLGYPAEVYAYGSQIFMNSIVFVIFVPFSCYFFMTVFYKMQLTSVYEYLEYRFDSRWVRWLASSIFIIQMSFFMGVCLYAPSIALESFIGLKMWYSVVGLGVCATVYTSIGGLKAVVWTDVFQLLMLMAGLFAIIIEGFMKSGGLLEAFEKTGHHGRLELFNFTIDPFMRHNTLNFILGHGFTIFCLYGTHQPQVQRYCSLPSLKHAIKAVIFAMPLSIFTVALCLLCGIVIFATYADCDPITLGHIRVADQIVPHFVKDQLGFIPGMMGLFTACVFSAALSTLSSGLNSIAAVIWEDFFVKIPVMKSMTQNGQANSVRALAAVFGFVAIGLAFLAPHMGHILAATITAMGAFNGPLGAVFFMGLLMPFVNKTGALCGMITGFISMSWITAGSFILKKSHIPLPYSVDACLDALPGSNNLTLPMNIQNIGSTEIEWPEKIFTLSYVMYPFVGGMITFSVGIVASILSGGCKQARNVEERYLHPLLRQKKSKDIFADINFNSQNHVDRLAKTSSIKSTAICYYDPLSTNTPISSPGVASQKPFLY